MTEKLKIGNFCPAASPMLKNLKSEDTKDSFLVLGLSPPLSSLSREKVLNQSSPSPKGAGLKSESLMAESESSLTESKK